MPLKNHRKKFISVNPPVLSLSPGSEVHLLHGDEPSPHGPLEAVHRILVVLLALQRVVEDPAGRIGRAAVVRLPSVAHRHPQVLEGVRREERRVQGKARILGLRGGTVVVSYIAIFKCSCFAQKKI